MSANQPAARSQPTAVAGGGARTCSHLPSARTVSSPPVAEGRAVNVGNTIVLMHQMCFYPRSLSPPTNQFPLLKSSAKRGRCKERCLHVRRMQPSCSAASGIIAAPCRPLNCTPTGIPDQTTMASMLCSRWRRLVPVTCHQNNDAQGTGHRITGSRPTGGPSQPRDRRRRRA